MKKMMNNKGITLVALVITIVILLILAGITISQLSGSGLFENAKLAEQKSDNAQEREEGILTDYENKIEDYISNTRNDNYKKVEKKNLGKLEYNFSSCSTSEIYKTYTLTKTIDIKETYKEYQQFDENNFSYEIDFISIGYPGSDSLWCYASKMWTAPVISYDSEEGMLSLTISVHNGYHDYFSKITANMYIFK